MLWVLRIQRLFSFFLNQPLQFQVDIIDNSQSLPTEQYSITTSISDSEFGSQNIMEFDSKIVSKTKDKKIVLVTTRQNVREPFIQIRLQLNRDGMNVSRIFNILLEPPTLLTTASGKNYLVKVKSADTVWSIAERFLQDNSFSIEQMMMAIFRLNPDAFLGENINRLKINSELLIPDIETIVSLSTKRRKNYFSNNMTTGKIKIIFKIKTWILIQRAMVSSQRLRF